jgi:hypothetical protein
MPPKQATSGSSRAPAKRASAASSRAVPATKRRAPAAATTSTISDDDADATPRRAEADEDEDEEEEEEDKAKTIPPGLLTRLLHEFFAKEGTRIHKDANEAVAKYMDVFVREAIARSCAERGGDGFLEVEDLEKVAPQLLLDM